MPTDPAHRALLRAVDRLTTQVRRIADTLEPPVATDDDGAQTTADDTPAWTLCTCGDTPVTAQHPETCPLSREPYASELAEMYGTDAAEWKTTAAVYSGLHSTAEDEVKQLRAELDEAKAAIERVRDVQAWLTRNYPGLTEPASRLFLALSPSSKEG
ncbi:hypothetical protein [Streptomyces anulatus]|uniref:hypothetical protein n=1 Tax=Streptomyces anulatus TaxID=1892 RepID=UPI001D187264|nr:hypothetical protein [Streptomyces anulatus]